MLWYYYGIARKPYLMVIAIAIFCSACIIVSFTVNSLPDFSDPTCGFETRGTDIGKRLMAWQNLLQETGRSGGLVADPNELRFFHENAFEVDNSNDYVAQRKRKNRRNRKGQHKRRKQKLDKQENQKIDKELTRKMLTFKNRSHTQSPQFTDWNGDSGIFHDYEITNDSLSFAEPTKHSEHFEYGRNTSFVDEDMHREKVQTKKSTWRILKQAAYYPTSSWSNYDVRVPIDGYFCDSPANKFSHFVVERIGPNATDTLFDLNGLLAICQLQDQITNIQHYDAYCEKEMLTDNCCRPWSIANYAALFANKSSCFDLTSDDVSSLQNLLVVCFEYFHDLKLSNDCSEYNRCYAPAECTRHNLVYNVLHFLTDSNFIKNNDSNVFLKYSMIFVPVVHSIKILPLFHEWEKTTLSNELVKVAAMDLGLENELFNELLLTDSWLVSLGGVFVMACIWLYTASLFITAMTFCAVFFSLGLAYFIYTLVFNLSFFPYMNLLAVVVIIGIGADDAFIFVKIWNCVLAERFTKATTTTAQMTLATLDIEYTETLQNIIAATVRHAACSMFVTSLTTAGAFYASYISSITAIKCFGIFAGTVVITNYLIMITWLPAAVSIMERLPSCTTSCSKLQKILLACNKSIIKFAQYFESAVVAAVMNYAYLWLILFGSIGILSAVIVLYYPGLQLPENSHFQLFVSQHPFEIYSTKLKNEFWFEKSLAAFENFKMPLRFVWGIDAIDDGDYTNPYDHGNLYYDNNFNVSTKAAQIWLLDFCQDLRQQPFYQHTIGIILPNCFIENFIDFMKRRCIDDMDSARTDRTPCCDADFPFDSYIFELCLPQSISNLYATPREYFIPGVAGPKFAAPTTHHHTFNTSLTRDEVDGGNITKTNSTVSTPPIVKALVIEFESNVTYTTVYHDVKNFVQTVETWFAKRLSTAPYEMQGGWFVSELKFFDVQDTLSHDTLIAISLAMTISLVVLLLVTFNVLISIYAVVTVSFTIFVTVAVLILLGWKLNILESIAVSTAIGLAVDFSLHYGIHYRLSPSTERFAATQFALSRIIGPTVMAAITTGFAGAIMLASNILPYIQIGIFLVAVMIVSWLYSTFFLMSLLRVAGPQYGFMQFKWPKMKKHASGNGIKYYERKPSQVIASEQLLTPSSSAVGDLINSETHELESLNSNTLIKTISGTDSTNAPNSYVDFEHSFLAADKQTDNPVRSVSAHQRRGCVSISINTCDYQNPSTSATRSANLELPATAAVATIDNTTDAKNF